ncbi:MAG: cytochrome c [Rhodospirillales bacterium]|nr:cytochrome c [Rhodospirillales bacterium]
MPRILSHFGLLVATLVLVGATVAPAYADGAADIKTRQELMKSMGGKMKALGAIMKGGDASMLGDHTAELAAIAKKVGTVFPAGSGPEAGKTEALANIWTDPEGFNKTVAGLIAATENLAKVAASGDLQATGAAMGMVGKDGCGACHKTYRMKKS